MIKKDTRTIQQKAYEESKRNNHYSGIEGFRRRRQELEQRKNNGGIPYNNGNMVQFPGFRGRFFATLLEKESLDRAIEVLPQNVYGIKHVAKWIYELYPKGSTIENIIKDCQKKYADSEHIQELIDALEEVDKEKKEKSSER